MTTHEQQPVASKANTPISVRSNDAARPVLRLKSKVLMHNLRELEIDHEGRIYRLRVTQLNKLILTA
ncbi:hemin uptake protein HemP [Undibacterium sp. MH2W]|uniref:hemin uptake protein HemP n=1 Tax=Undibacterium sp. MH2W TaxID=3413044 RepID=UPI003BF21A52